MGGEICAGDEITLMSESKLLKTREHPVTGIEWPAEVVLDCDGSMPDGIYAYDNPSAFGVQYVRHDLSTAYKQDLAAIHQGIRTEFTQGELSDVVSDFEHFFEHHKDVELKRNEAIEALKVAHQFMLEVSHCQHSGASWFTRGESGLFSHIEGWCGRMHDALKKVMPNYGNTLK